MSCALKPPAILILWYSIYGIHLWCMYGTAFLGLLIFPHYLLTRLFSLLLASWGREPLEFVRGHATKISFVVVRQCLQLCVSWVTYFHRVSYHGIIEIIKQGMAKIVKERKRKRLFVVFLFMSDPVGSVVFILTTQRRPEDSAMTLIGSQTHPSTIHRISP